MRSTSRDATKTLSLPEAACRRDMFRQGLQEVRCSKITPGSIPGWGVSVGCWGRPESDDVLSSAPDPSRRPGVPWTGLTAHDDRRRWEMGRWEMEDRTRPYGAHQSLRGGTGSAYHWTATAAVVTPAPTEQRISLSPGSRLSSISASASGMLALEVFPTRSTFR
jgi:hypothetical protein